MGTNYYAVKNACPTCGHGKNSEHIGKSSCGWSFTFRGYLPDRASAADWRREFEQENVSIVDEYGDRISMEDFWKKVEAHKKWGGVFEKCTGEDWWASHQHEYWKDSEGNTFCSAEFS